MSTAQGWHIFQPVFCRFLQRSYDFVSAKTHDRRTVRRLNLIYESTRECLLIRCERSWASARVIGALADGIVMKGIPEHLRSDNGPEFAAQDLRKWLAATGAKTLHIEPGSPWENGYCESSNSKLRDEFLNGEILYSMKKLRVLAERWRVHYNTVRPHSSLGCKPPAPATGCVLIPLRYTNNLAGTKDRADHSRLPSTDRGCQQSRTGSKKEPAP